MIPMSRDQQGEGRLGQKQTWVEVAMLPLSVSVTLRRSPKFSVRPQNPHQGLLRDLRGLTERRYVDQ